MGQDFIIRGSLSEVDPDVYDLIKRETTRQDNTIILIASESETPDAVHEAVASPFGHVYAEGYPRESSRRQSEADILDVEYELAYYRRYSDPRYYKGVEYADIAEALCRRRAAELFAANGIPADRLFINVQPLSGGPANSAVYSALLNPGDRILGLKLSDGGHLSHGAPVNRSGLVYQSHSYIVDPATERLDYDAIEKLALKIKPNIIVAGFSAYPLIIDWQRFRQIADKVGAYLLADIAHISGLVAAGVHPSPIGIADVVSTTTHKSLCGPRGAMIMTHRKDVSEKIDKAVFPGEQGGPHVNTIVGLAVALKLAQSATFKALQRRIVANAARLAQQLEARGLRVVAGGSENHLLLVDCKSVRVDGVPLSGDMAARILDLAGIVVNRNNIPGDKSALNPFGVRLGLVWASQRGFDSAEIDLLAEAIATVLNGCTPFFYRGSKGKEFRAKVDPVALARARAIVRQLTGQGDDAVDPALSAVTVRGDNATAFLDQVLPSRVLALAPGDAQASHLFGPELDTPVVVARRAGDYAVYCGDAATAARVCQWLADLSDGYVHFGDLHGKLPGPVVVQTAALGPAPAVAAADPAMWHTPFYVGHERAPGGEPLPSFVWQPAEKPLQHTRLHALHVALGAKMVPFGGWDMPVWYSSVSEEHAAVRQSAGLFDVSHMGAFEVSGPGSAEFLDLITTNDITKLKVNASHYTYLLDPSGRVIDDLLVYRLGDEQFMLVVNAANNDEDWAWINAVNSGSVRIDNDRPWKRVAAPVAIRDLRDPQWGRDCRVDIALQGPKSTDILLALGTDDAAAARIRKLPWAGLTRAVVGGIDLIVSRTGYTGERTAYELFVHPEQSPALFEALVAAGAVPCGLAARDSTRTEAGLPLHGHELAGPYQVTPHEAGFTGYVKLWKPVFIGRSASISQMLEPERTIIRFRMNEKGVRRPELGDPILDKRGKVVGLVTSCAIDSDGFLLGQALVPNDMRKPGTQLPIYQTGGGSRGLRVSAEITLGARLPQPDSATVLTRFP